MEQFEIVLKNGETVVLDMSIFEIDESKGMVNLTKIGKACGKEVRTWSNTDQTKEFLEACKNSFDDFEGLTVVKGGSGEQGTWATREVALDFAMWISPRFKVWCIKALDELFQKGTVSLQTPQSYGEALLAHAQTVMEKERLEKQLLITNDTLLITQAVVVEKQNEVERKSKSVRKNVAKTGGLTYSRNLKQRKLEDVCASRNVPTPDEWEFFQKEDRRKDNLVKKQRQLIDIYEAED